MKTSVITTLLIVLMLGMTPSADAQLLVAGSAEDKAFTAIEAEANPDAKETLLLDFERQFPQSKVLPDIYVMLIEVYRLKNNDAKVAEFGEKAIALDPENVTALMAVSRSYIMQRRNQDRAGQYAQKAVDVLGKLKTQAAPARYTDAQWKDWLSSTEQAATSWLAYVRTVNR